MMRTIRLKDNYYFVISGTESGTNIAHLEFHQYHSAEGAFDAKLEKNFDVQLSENTNLPVSEEPKKQLHNKLNCFASNTKNWI